MLGLGRTFRRRLQGHGFVLHRGHPTICLRIFRSYKNLDMHLNRERKQRILHCLKVQNYLWRRRQLYYLKFHTQFIFI